MWYVIQVRTGTEESVKKQCEKLIGRDAMERCFIPYYEEMKRYQGAWHKETGTLFPGYVFLVSDNLDQLYEELKKVIGLTKLLGSGDEVIPLADEEITFMRRFGGEDQVVPMSIGVIENDQVVIMEGPLKGREGMIRKIDRHKKKAWIEMEMFRRKQVVEIGVEIVGKK